MAIQSQNAQPQLQHADKLPGLIGLRTLLLSSALMVSAGQACAQTATQAVTKAGTPSGTGSSIVAKPAATAQPDQTAATSEIVVTATRRAEKLSRVPLSVTAFSQATLDRQGVTRIEDIVRLTPSLNFSRATGSGTGYASTISIRGVSSTVGTSTTGIYIDDTPIQTRALLIVSGSAFPQVFDLDRVEVLRGPQGTLFGAGAEGGVVRFITPQPNFDKVSGTARFELGETDGGAPSYEAGMAVGAPIITDQLAARASFWYRRDGGWIDRVDPGTGQVLDHNGNSEESYAGKFALSWRATPDLTFTPSLYYQNVHDDERSQYWENLGSAPNFREGSLIPEPSSDKFLLPALKVQYDGGGISLVSNTSYFRRDYTSVYNYTQYVLAALGLPQTITVPQGLPGTADASISDVKQRNFTQEVRLQSSSSSRMQWVLGAFYSHNDQIGDQHLTGQTTNALFESILGGGYLQLTGIPLVDGVYSFVTHLSSVETQLAVFADVNFALTSKLKVEAGLRAARAHFSYTQTSVGPLVSAVPIVNGGATTENPVTPKFGVSYQVDQNNFIYASAAKGYRIGGAQPELLASCNAELASLGYTSSPTAYKSDSLWSYEVGTKNAILGGRIHVDASLFYIDWSNIQSQIRLDSCGGATIVGNLGSATSKGADLTIQATIAHGLNVTAAMGYTSAHYNDTITSSSGAVFSAAGEPLGGPPLNLSLSAQYDTRTIWNLPTYFRADYQYRSRGTAPDPVIYNYDPTIARMPAQNYINLRVGAMVRLWDISAFAENVTNAHPGLFESRDTVGGPIAYNATVRPRYIGVTAVRRF